MNIGIDNWIEDVPQISCLSQLIKKKDYANEMYSGNKSKQDSLN